MNKRKYSSYQLNPISDLYLHNNNDNYNLYYNYNNYCNCDEIVLKNNYIYFNSTINFETISTLIMYINFINSKKDLYNIVYLYINSKGGLLKAFLNFIQYKKSCSIEIISIIDKECIDCGLFLAALCDYRIIKKNAICKFNTYDVNNKYNNYWYIFKQYDIFNDNDNDNSNDISQLINICYENIKSKISKEKLEKYLLQNNTWNSKKYKKIGLADEIV